MEYTTPIFTSLDQVPPPPTEDILRVSGMTIVVYVAHRLESQTIQARLSHPPVRPIEHQYGYGDKLSPACELSYSHYVSAGELPGGIAPTADGPTELGQSLLWMGGDYLLSSVPFVFSTPRTDGLRHIEIPSPLDTEGCLALIKSIIAPEQVERLKEQVTDSLVHQGILRPSDVVRSWTLENCLAVQIWDLTGTRGRGDTARYAGIRESRDYAWQISALLGYSSDHILMDGLWLQRGPEHVFQETSTGLRFLDDHMVFVNGACCLEIGHLPGYLRDRSRYRLGNYGYDSSSMFVWTAGALRSAVSDDLTGRYREIIAELNRRTGMSAVEHTAFALARLQHDTLVDRVARFHGMLVEPRNRVLDNRIDTLRGFRESLQGLRNDMDKAQSIASTLLRVQEQASQSRTNTLLATLAVALTVTGIPGLVEQVGKWWGAGDWPQLAVSAAFSFMIFGIVTRVWAARR